MTEYGRHKRNLKGGKSSNNCSKNTSRRRNSVTGTNKADIEARIAHLNDKTADHSKSPKKLDIDLAELDNLDTLIGQDKTAWAIEKAKLEKAKTDAEKLTTDKNGELVKKVEELDKYKQEVAEKLTEELVKKLEKVADSTPADQTTKLTEIKTIIDDIKTKGAKADLTDITSKVDALTSTAANIKENQEKGKGGGDNTTKFSAIAAAVLAGVALMISVYHAFFKPNGNGQIREKDSQE